VLDVVYNHVGPGDEALEAFGPYFTTRYETFWGKALDYSQRAVREWAVQNAELWIRDYKVDGLRLDAVHAIFDDESPVHVCAELKQRVGDAIVTSETEIGDRRPIEEWGHDAEWQDALHHALHALLTGERDGYYAPFGSIEDVARELRNQESAHVAGLEGEVPDPQDEQTFLRSKLEPGPAVDWFREAVALRRELPDELEVEVDGPRLRARRGARMLVLDFDALTVER